jgi:hypothetical protein
VPQCALRNPDQLSITELEFDEAQRLGRPILLFIMDEHYPTDVTQPEENSTRRRKLKRFRERAKRFAPDAKVHRVFAMFDSMESFIERANRGVAALRRHLDDVHSFGARNDGGTPYPTHSTRTVVPPAFYAVPHYVGSNRFIGRTAQLDMLSDWASPANPYPVLLFDAIGGAGKSMLTWEWNVTHAARVRGDWAGQCWFSLYERSMTLADVCHNVLTYMGESPTELRNKNRIESVDTLVSRLRSQPWLITLDGLERALVAYHRYDASQQSDEQAGSRDEIADRHPCAAVRPEDDELLRLLTAAAPSKILITSRLVPKILLNASNQAIPGVLRESLPGLRPSEAESLLRECGVVGESVAIQRFLQSHCDCHPLVTVIVAGLINEYLPDRGNFDAWAADASAGGALDVVNLDLVEKRTHILGMSLRGLSKGSHQLISMLALFPDSVDYSILEMLTRVSIGDSSLDTSSELAHAVNDLERRGLLQYDRRQQRYDLHPVVRTVAAGALTIEERRRYSEHVAGRFVAKVMPTITSVETIEGLRGAIRVMKVMLQIGQRREAFELLTQKGMQTALFNTEGEVEVLPILRACFSDGWDRRPADLEGRDCRHAASIAAQGLRGIGAWADALAADGIAIYDSLQSAEWKSLVTYLGNVSLTLQRQNRLAARDRVSQLQVSLAEAIKDPERLGYAQMHRLWHLAQTGQWESADKVWLFLKSVGFGGTRLSHLKGHPEMTFAWLQYWRGGVSDHYIAEAEELAVAGRNRLALRQLRRLRAESLMDQEKWHEAAGYFRDAVRMAREVSIVDVAAETGLALAEHQSGRLAASMQMADELLRGGAPHYRWLAELFFALGAVERAKECARMAYSWACADGEPYVYRWELERTKAAMRELDTEIPATPRYAAAQDVRLPWEGAVEMVTKRIASIGTH